MNKDNLQKYISAKRPILYFNDYDYREVDNFIREGMNQVEDGVIYEYRAFGEVDFATKKLLGETDLFNFINNLYIYGIEQNTLLVLKDADIELQDPKVVALLKKVAEMNAYDPHYNCMVVIVSQEPQPPKGLENFITLVNLPKMGEEEIRQYLLTLAQEKGLRVVEGDLSDIAISLKGLSKWYITQVVNMMDSVSSANINKVIREKGQIIKKSGILELIDFKEKSTDIGGLENLKDWLNKKADIFRNLDKAKKFGVDTPKGLLLVGMPGCGKSLSAKVASRMFNVPLLRLDIGRLLGKYVGESEHNLRKALEMAEAVSPCILWIDEVEKAFSGMDKDGGASDITKRLFGHFLTWLQEKENTVFVVATANDISSFPPEFLRKGRFDEIFYVDFPNKDEREEIFRIHLEKRGQNRNQAINLTKLAEKTNGYSGADIEEVVKLAVEDKFVNFLKDSKQEEVKQKDVEEAIEAIDSMSSILKEKIQGLKDAFKKFRLQPASLAEGQKKGTKRSRVPEEKDMVFVRGGKYVPSFFNEERKVDDLYVGKFNVTVEEFLEFSEKRRKDKRMYYRLETQGGSGRIPVNVSMVNRNQGTISTIIPNNIMFMDYCNYLSEKYSLQPVYKIIDEKLVRIIYSDGTEVVPDQADFSRTEGYRLPTELEWEWFARGGDVAQQDGTFNLPFAGSKDINQVAWYKGNSGYRIHTVGTKAPNPLGLYDCCGNVDEYVYDKRSRKKENLYLRPDKPYIYDDSVDSIYRGGYFNSEIADLVINGDDKSYSQVKAPSSIIGRVLEDRLSKDFIGFRVVKNA